uniref:Uncharacterized protein n=1 Tax=Megaviridae environmental sample TaxID=1737588 RepID=A0A5J6VJ53_9VIRU|nr:MAG: hypothetical protein [Megaviridae environmental sample]
MNDEIQTLVSQLEESWDQKKYSDIITKITSEQKRLEEYISLIKKQPQINNTNINICEWETKLQSALHLDDEIKIYQDLISALETQDDKMHIEYLG